MNEKFKNEAAAADVLVSSHNIKKSRRKSFRMADDVSAECLFERLRGFQPRAPDAAEVARGIVARINSRITSHDKHIRQSTLDKLWNKQSSPIQNLVSILENTRDAATSSYIISILRETLCLKQGRGKKNSVNNVARQQCAQHFISVNGTQVILRVLVNTQCKRDSNVGTELVLQDLVWIIAALAPKDPKFAMKVRMIGCVRTMHLIFKGHYTDNKLIFPLLVIIKQLSKNPVTTSILVRDGIVATYERVLVSLGYIPTARLRLCLDAINYFSKKHLSFSRCRKLTIYLESYPNNANPDVERCVRKKHVQILHRFCSQCPEEPEFDGILARVCSVITLCLKHQAFPVPSSSPATFNLNPILKGTNTSWPCHEDEDDAANSDTKTVNSDLDDDEQEPDIEGVEEIDSDCQDIKSDRINDIEKINFKASESAQSALWINPNERDIEDLKKYCIYFKEFGSYNKQIRQVKSRSNSRGSILEDFLNQSSGSKNTSSSLNLSLCALLGNNDYERISESPQTSIFACCNRITESPSFTSNSSLKIHKDLSKYTLSQTAYCVIASRVRSVIPFVKVAYPDLNGGQSFNRPEPLNKMERLACRSKLLSCVDKAINPESYMNDVVYDLDQLCSSTGPESVQKSADNMLTNTDEQDISKANTFPTRLSFESRFESGNLRKAIQVGPREYDLILMPDVNSPKRHQWFYFEVRNMQQGRPYIFNIVNCEKSDSQFNFGMKPVLYSVKEAISGKPGWVRAGSEICYYRNSYHYANQKSHNKCYMTVTFNIDFPHSNDVCYIAYHFPFTYSMLMTRILQWSLQVPLGTYFRSEALCFSLNNNEVPLVTITAEDSASNPIVDREIIFLTARVHPGESNASWVMDGTLRCLLSDSPNAASIRSKYVFKIVPMLNVEGVINGCHRCGLTNEDLNRRWCKPSPVLHPSIYHTKGLIEYLVRVWRKPPLVFCDYHGHSRKKNVFFYGCAGAESWCSSDRLVPDEPVKYLMLPALMHRISGAFALGSCSFRVERERESTARVAVWRHLAVARSYTMEASFCGFDQGPYKGFHLNTQHLQGVGSDLCEALAGLGDGATVDLQLTKELNGEKTVDSEQGSGSDSVLRTDSDEEFD